MKHFMIVFSCIFILVSTVRADEYVLENQSIGRMVSTDGGVLRTVAIVNKRADVTAKPTDSPEFRLRFSEGTDKPDTQFTLTAADFKVVSQTPGENVMLFQLENVEHRLRVDVQYELEPDDFYMHKRLTITTAEPITLERIDVETFRLLDAFQPYKVRQITANAPSQWSPGLGQPLYTNQSGTFWGVEFPAADNQVRDGELVAGYLWGRELEPGRPYESYRAVVGVADDPAFVSDAFQEYINCVRIRPLRLEVQYNSWFDYGHGVRKETFRDSVARIHHELVVQRGNRPFNMYVIDDGWQDTAADWSDKVWKINDKFDPDFASSRQATSDAQAKLGLWLSPGCLFGAQSEVGRLRSQGFEAMDNWMSMAGPRYMQSLQDRMVELTRLGVGFYKLDGLFGHLNQRNFELHGAKYGLPEMPQLGVQGFASNDKRLNDPKYDELKIYYLSAGTERLMQLFDKLAETDPNIYIVISNGAYLSPWWLMHVDAVWMINAGDAAGGSSRTQQLVYRDDRYYEIWREQNCQFPMCSIFNHEPKKTSTGESKDEFRRYLYMNLSRGTGFVEFYIKPFVLQPGDWDVISEGLLWVRDIFPTFARVRMHGGSPKAGDVYGYTAWNRTQGYVSVHNPSATTKRYAITLNRTFGLLPESGPYTISSPLADCTRDLPATCQFGDTLALELQPGEIRILNFSTEPKDWSKLRQLQNRSPETANKRPVLQSTPVKDHAILGTWEYPHNGSIYTRTFAENGVCTLRQNGEIVWEKPYRVLGPDQVIVDGGLNHRLNSDDVLEIEGRYQAKRRSDRH